MRIGIDATVVDYNREGIGNFVLQLVDHLDKAPHKGIEYILFVHPGFREEYRDLAERFETVEIAKLNGFASGIRTAFLMRFRRKSIGVDLFISTHSHLVSLLIHPNFWLVHDISPIVHPEYFNIDIARVKNQIIRYDFKRAMERTRLILTTSEFNRREIEKNYISAPDKTKVIGAGPASWIEQNPSKKKQREVLAEHELVENRYLLFIGTLSPRKNIERLLEAYAKYIIDHPSSQLELVIAGKKGWKYGSIFSTWEKLQEDNPDLSLDQRIRFTGFIEDEAMNVLARNCKALVYPPLYEGFGMPPLEALLLGKEVILSSIPVLREHYSDIGHFFPPRNVAKFAQAIEGVSKGKKLNTQELRDKLRQDFAWEGVAKRVKDAIVAYAENNWEFTPEDG